jgi:membrane fusion protein YbhG
MLEAHLAPMVWIMWRWRILLVGLAALGIAAGSALLWRSHPSNVLLLSGNIEAHESVLSFQVPGRIIDLPVEEGKWIERDAIMARLDDRDYRQQVAVDEAAVKVAEAQFKLALAGTRHQEIEAIRQAMLNAEADAAQRQLDFERAQQLYETDATAKAVRDQAETNLKQARAAYKEARQHYDEAVEGTRKEEIAIAAANVDRANESLKFARIQLDHTILRAPFEGVTLVRQAELGEVVTAGTPVFTFADLDHIWLRAYVSETDLARIRWDMPATITTDTYPGKRYRGRISFIASKAEFTPKTIETHEERVTLVYRIKIDLENPNYELKPGMPADARIELTPARSNG